MQPKQRYLLSEAGCELPELHARSITSMALAITAAVSNEYHADPAESDFAGILRADLAGIRSSKSKAMQVELCAARSAG